MSVDQRMQQTKHIYAFSEAQMLDLTNSCTPFMPQIVVTFLPLLHQTQHMADLLRIL